ncbi:hypothetical protein EV586_103246 [Tumebacillus sp. BK434]|uniref:hypothetical protein n=1 Tax=Tumebacillus sp. BK434 TaxID=2512169 RepID=UPI00104F49EC|nr:hypothetical protein [Tumebacillus sp. BK434]TCP55593.1 hypothetical protein EV586_103246 [Tumebacillus sp. BK434]
MRARYQSAGSLAWTAAATGGPLIGGLVMEQFGGHALFVTFACVMASAVFFYRLMEVKKTGKRHSLAH